VSATVRHYTARVLDRRRLSPRSFELTIRRPTDFTFRAELPDGSYDFYLCGGGNMVREVMGWVDARFPQARIFTERFY
jgi:ferredoxin-NADP reductase